MPASDLFTDDQADEDLNDQPVVEPGPAPATWAHAFHDRARLRWDVMSRRQRIAVGVVFVVLLCALYGMNHRSATPVPAAPAPSTAVASGGVPVAATTAAPKPVLVEKAANRAKDDPLRALPDLNPAVVAYAGGDATPFANVIAVARAGGADICKLWFGIVANPTTGQLGWKVVPAIDPAEHYPNDVFTSRVFVGGPCGPMAGNPNPVIVPTTTPAKS